MMNPTDIYVSMIDNVTDELESFGVEMELYLDVSGSDSSDYPLYAEPRALKKAVKHLATAGELLLKYRLQLEHWAFIFHDINAASKEKIDSGDFESVYYKDTVKRLRNLCGIEVGFFYFPKLRNLRNSAEHFELRTTLLEIIQIIIGAIDELLNFIDCYITIDEEECEEINWVSSINRVQEIQKTLKELSVRHQNQTFTPN